MKLTVADEQNDEMINNLLAEIGRREQMTLAAQKALRTRVLAIVKELPTNQGIELLQALQRTEAQTNHDARVQLLNRVDLPKAKVAWEEEKERLEELCQEYKELYDASVRALEAFQIDIAGRPSWEEVRKGLTLRVLNAAKHLKKKLVILVPPLTRQQLVGAIDNQTGSYGIEAPTVKHRFDDDTLYNDSMAEENLDWEVWIVEGIKHVDVNEELQKEDGNFRKNHEQVSALLQGLRSRGLEALSGVRSYLVAMMATLVDGRKLDVQNWTVLNTNTVVQNPNSLLGYGSWRAGQVCLIGDKPNVRDFNLRVRSAVRVKVRL